MSKAMHLIDLLAQTQALPFELRMRLLEQEKRELENDEQALTGLVPAPILTAHHEVTQ